MDAIADWLESFIACPHPDLGREGPVCPSLPRAIALERVFVRHARLQSSGIGDDREQLAAELLTIAAAFRPLRTLDDWPLECLIVTVPALSPSAFRYVLEGAYLDVKPAILRMGLMVGAFYPFSNRPSLLNSDFYPMRSPIPFFALRHMLEVDWRTLQERPEYMEAYRLHFATDADPGEVRQR